eukprot:9154080-Pyramimonas_sp.AAC.1
MCKLSSAHKSPSARSSSFAAGWLELCSWCPVALYVQQRTNNVVTFARLEVPTACVTFRKGVCMQHAGNIAPVVCPTFR